MNEEKLFFSPTKDIVTNVLKSRALQNCFELLVGSSFAYNTPSQERMNTETFVIWKKKYASTGDPIAFITLEKWKRIYVPTFSWKWKIFFLYSPA